MSNTPHDHIIDEGIAREVARLQAHGVETYESCQGGPGHAYPEPTICFHGDRAEGFRCLAIAIQEAMPVDSLRRVWHVINGEPTGPYWEMTFRR